MATSVTVMLILVSHICSIALWAWVFIVIGELGSFETAFYFSGVSYTTLGYGDIILSKAWRLLGPLEAVNGAIMLGWTTAILFGVQLSLIRQRLKTKSPL
ncbi:MAG TPA: potassium channel family protein [Thermodesulfobacteriota bacterium]